MSEIDWRWPVALKEGDRLIFEVNRVDLEVRLYWHDVAVYYLSRDGAPGDPFDLALNRKYVLRYNNNDGGEGYLSCHIATVSPSGVRSICYPIEHAGINGPFVIEVPFLLYQDTT